MASPLVSVILTTNRGGPYLQDAVDSVRAQTFTDWEMVVVDDGSDVPQEIDDAVRDVPRARVVRQPNSGLSVGRNVGFANSLGALIAYIDDDDVWHPERLTLQTAALEADKGAIGCNSGWWYMDKAGVTFGDLISVPRATPDDYLSGRVPVPWLNTLLFRRGVMQRVGGFLPTFRRAEDTELILRIVREGPIVTLPDQLLGYRRHEENLTEVNVNHLMEVSELRALTLQIWGAEARGDRGEWQLLDAQLAQLRARIATTQARKISHLVRHGDWRAAAHEATWSLRTIPVDLAARAAGLALRKLGARRGDPPET